MKEEKLLESIFQQANQLFLKREYENILRNVSERNLCGSLKGCFEKVLEKTEYSNYYVDIEYNRNQDYIKMILNEQEKLVAITCDLIIHSRGKFEKDNLLCLEMKKSTASKQEKDKDKERLIALTKKSYQDIWPYHGIDPQYVCNYVIGIYYEMNRFKQTYYLEFYRNGKLWKKEEHSF